MALPAPDFQDEVANSMNALQKLYPNTFDVKKYLYLPNGKYSFAAEQTIQGRSKKEFKLDSEHPNSSIYARACAIAGHKVTCLWKTWDISTARKEFFQELYFYSHPELLRWLQGVIVPHIIGVHHELDGRKTILMEAPHHIHWHTASPRLCPSEKDRIIRAYEKLHTHGIMHNNISLRNIFIDQDMNVTLVNFETACCLNDKGIGEVPTCDQEALAREMRQVKYLIDHMGAKVLEREVLRTSQAGASHSEQQMEPLSTWDMDRWDQLASHSEHTYTIPRDIRNRPLPNDGRKKAKPPKKGSLKDKVAMSSEKLGSSMLGDFTQDTVRSESQSDPYGLLLTVSPSSSISVSTPPPSLHTPADIQEFFPLDELPHSLPSTPFDGEISGAMERDASMKSPSSESDLGALQAACNSQHAYRSFVSSHSMSSLPSRLPPFISDVPVQSALTPLSVANSALPELSNHPSSNRPPSPKVFCDLSHEQLRLAIKQHNAAVDTKLTSQALVNTDKNRVVFHPATNDNGTYATGSDLFRKRKKRRRLTPFFPEDSHSEEQETDSDEYEEGEEPEPHIEVDFEDLVDEAHLAKIRSRRRTSRPGILPSMVPVKFLQPKLSCAAQCTTDTIPSSTLTSIGEERSPRDDSAIPPHSVIFVGANGSPDEAWQLPVSAFLFLKSLATSQPQAKKLRVEQVPRLHEPSSPLLTPSNQIHSQTSKKRKFDCIRETEYPERKSQRVRQNTMPSSCVIC